MSCFHVATNCGVGLIYKDYKVGEGRPPADGEQVVFQYTAYNESGRLIDSTYRQDRPAEIRMGINGLIPGAAKSALLH
jgi:FKBP-type peptidyl-prolyl cis-trans isomerase